MILSRIALLVVGLLISLACAPAARAETPASFRDFKVYTTSAPHPDDATRIVATMQLVNAGRAPLDVHVTLDGNFAAGFAGTKLDARIAAGQNATRTFELKPPDGLKYEMLIGAIAFREAVAEPERELYIAVQGVDPADLADKRVERINSRAQVVGTHAPLTIGHVRKRTTPATGASRLVLATNGVTKYHIALDTPAPELADAVIDLQRCIEIKSGAMLEVGSAQGPAIQLRRVALGGHLEAYRLRTDGDDVIIEASTADGLRNGVYGLLTDHLDCHWFMPSPLGEEVAVPANRTVRLPSLDETRAPSFASSIGMSWSAYPRWDRQNRSVINRGRMNFGHAWAGLIDRNQYPYEQFHDMWSRDRAGKVQVFDSDWSSTNFCSTNPDVIRIVAERINAQFDANPDAIVASIDPNDMAPLCQCDRCLALDASYGVTPADDKQMADRLVHFSKEIYDRLKPQHKDKFLGILAYGYQTRPPKKALPHPHHATTVCDFPYYFDHTRPFNDPTSSYNREFASIVKGWGSKVKQLGFYDYYGHFEFFGPWGIVHKMREDLPAFREAGGTFVVIEAQPNFAMNGLNLYVAARLVWDVNADVDALVEEYVTQFYGPAADPMRDFFRANERFYALTRPGLRAANRVGENPQFWTELDGHLKRAEEAVKGLPDVSKRFADRIVFTRDGFNFGRRFAELQTHANDAAWLRETKAEFDRCKAKYGERDAYWPTMVRPYFYPDIDAMLKKLETPSPK
jgi:hypothetical protein